MKDFEYLKNFLLKNGHPLFRAKQIYQAIYREAKTSFENINNLPRDLKFSLDKEMKILSVMPVYHSKSNDGTIKTLFQLEDKNKIEAVMMPFDDGRITICVSSQVGCAFKCKFCATGEMGFKRNLTAEEITDQVLYFNQILFNEGKKVTHIVYMGMGEPFMNFEEMKKSLFWLNSDIAFGIGARHITVSSSGVTDFISEFSDIDLQVNLAVSLHAPNQQLREKLMPHAKKFTLNELMNEIKEYTSKTHRRVSYEYVMLKGVNDSPQIAHELGKLLTGQLCHVNVIRYNSTYADFSGTRMKDIRDFENIVKSYGVPISLRISKGQDIDAACGQLAVKRVLRAES